MKLIIITAFVIAATSCYSQEKDKDAMVKKIFSVLKNKDEAGFIKLFPDAVTVKNFILGIINNDTSKKNNPGIKKSLDSLTDSSLEKEAREDFWEYIAKGEENGVVWSKASFRSYTADSAADVEEGIQTPRLKGKIYFNVESTEFFLTYSEVLWLDNKGWYGVEVDQVDKRSNENEPYEYDLLHDALMADTATTVKDTSLKARIKKIPPKKVKPASPKPLQKSEPVKTKSQTPARRPG